MEKNRDIVLYYIDQLVDEVEAVNIKQPTKRDIAAYMDAWLNTLRTIKSILEE
jgi:hypothetical protein